MNTDWIDITLTPTDVLNMNSAITLLENTDTDKFYEVEKLVFKLKYNSIPYNYVGNIYFKNGIERLATFQADSLSSSNNVVTISNSLLCKDVCSPLLTLSDGIKMELENTPPTEGDSNVEIRVYYILHEF